MTDRPAGGTGRPLRVLRIYHSGVVAAWRERDRQLRAQGVDVTLVSARRWDEGGQVVRLDPGDDDFVVGVRTLGKHPYRFLYDPLALWRVLRSAPFDVIDVHEEPASLAVAEVRLLARLAGRRAPVCLYSAQNILKSYPAPFRWFERRALRRSKAVHTCNEEVGEVLRRKGFRGLVRNLGLGVDVHRFRPAWRGAPAGAAPDPDGPRLRVGYVGRLEGHKGVDVLVDAVAALDGVELTVVGAGPEREALLDRIAAHGLSHRARITGYATQDELPELYRSFDVLAVPSLDQPGWIEQFGRVAVEAMASGVPVVASDSGSLPEVVGDTGALVPPGDVAALAAALDRLAGDPRARRQLGERARQRAQRWSWPAIARRHHDLYRDVVA